MKGSTGRILRVRRLLEEVAKAALEAKTTEIARIEQAARARSNQAVEGRTLAMKHLLAADSGAWTCALADAELFRCKEQRLGAAADLRRPALEDTRQQLIGSRRERLQVEAVATVATRREERARLRREQQMIDEWFQTRRRRSASRP